MGARAAHRKGFHEPSEHRLGRRALIAIARLMQLHHETHPDRIAQHFGVSRIYVARLWSEIPLTEMADTRDALELFRQVKLAKGPACE